MLNREDCDLKSSCPRPDTTETRLPVCVSICVCGVVSYGDLVNERAVLWILECVGHRAVGPRRHAGGTLKKALDQGHNITYRLLDLRRLLRTFGEHMC